MYKKGHFAPPQLWCTSYNPVLFSGAAAGVTAGCRGESLEVEMDADFLKNLSYERSPWTRSFAFGSRSPVPGQVMSADRMCPEIEIMAWWQGLHLAGRTDAARVADSSLAAWEHSTSHGKLQTCNPDVPVPSLTNGLWWADTASLLTAALSYLIIHIYSEVYVWAGWENMGFFFIFFFFLVISN